MIGMNNKELLLKDVKALIFDYDGVLSDGTVIIMENGNHVRTGFVKDGYAVQLAVKKGFKVAVISGGLSESMMSRCRVLGIKDAFFGVKNKLETFYEYLAMNNIDKREVLFMGDDIPDYPVMKEAGISACPLDAAEEIKEISMIISKYPGGRGCVRDVVEQVLKAQGMWMDNDAFTW